MHKSKFKQIALAVCFAFLPLSAHSAGLGKLTVISGLGEPLSAEIDLVSTTPDELSSLTASIAPYEAYSIQGIERTSIHNAIKIEVVGKPDGGAKLKLSTHQPVEDPFLDMLIQVDWATGRLLREYTVLLDPPGYRDPQPSIVTVPSTRIEPAPLQEPRPPAGQTEETTVKPAPRPVAAPQTDKTITTRSGDTLNKIAREMQVVGYSLDQMLVGIYRANQQAFTAENMHRLKVGQIIKAPSAAELSNITQREAREEIRVQTADWNAYRNRLAELVAESAPASEVAVDEAASGKLKAAAEDKSAPAVSGPKDVVKLSKSDAEAAGQASEVKALQDRLNAMQEENTAREKSAREADERAAMLEKQVADLQALLTIKNQMMADLQQNATGADVPAAPAEAQVELPAAQEAKPAVPAPEAKPKPSAKKKPAPNFEPVEEPGLLDNLTHNTPVLALAGGALVLLGGGWFFLRNRRKRNLDSFERGILTAGGLRANTVFGNTKGGRVETGDTSFLTDFSQSSSGMIDTHDVDPIAEAEVYMAYGRDSQAVEILNDAIKKDSKRYELHLKLLEIFAGRRDTSAFEAVAGELYSTLGAEDPVWLKVVEMGSRLEPANPLYDLSKSQNPAQYAPPASVAAEADQTVAATGPETENPVAATETSAAETEVAESSDADKDQLDSALEFSLDGLEKDSGLEKEGGLEKEAAPEPTPVDFPTSVTAEPQEDGSLDFELDVDTSNASPKNKESVDEALMLPELEPIAPLPIAPLNETTAESGLAIESGLPDLELPDLDLDAEQSPVNADRDSGVAGLSEDGDASIVAEFEPDLQKGDQLAVEHDISDIDLGLDSLANETAKLKVLQEQTEESTADSHEEILQQGGPELDLSGISLELDSEESEPETIEIKTPEAEADEVDTKLDLVTAYLDMGDHEGARELIDEVMKEGSEKQRERAQALSSRLA